MSHEYKGGRIEYGYGDGDVIKFLKTKGLEDAETKKIISEWATREEELINKLEGEYYKRAQIRLNLKRAVLCLDAEYKNLALENFADALQQAFQEGFGDLYYEILDKVEARGFNFNNLGTCF